MPMDPDVCKYSAQKRKSVNAYKSGSAHVQSEFQRVLDRVALACRIHTVVTQHMRTMNDVSFVSQQTIDVV